MRRVVPGRHRRGAELVADGSHHASGPSGTSCATVSTIRGSKPARQLHDGGREPRRRRPGTCRSTRPGSPRCRYTAPLTNRLLLEAGYAYQRGDFRVNYQPANPTNRPREVGPRPGPHRGQHRPRLQQPGAEEEAKFCVSYVTGSHSIKAGFEDCWANAMQANPYNSDIASRSPTTTRRTGDRDKRAVAEQDAVRLGRRRLHPGPVAPRPVHVQPGGGYDKFSPFIPAQSEPDSNFVPGVSIRADHNTPNWNDWATRTGMAWDMFGTGKTAVKFFAGRFVAGEAFSRTSQFNPIYSRTDTRGWTDLNGDLTVSHGRWVGRSSRRSAPAPGTSARRKVDKLDPELKRDKNWTYELTAHHELFPRVQVLAATTAGGTSTWRTPIIW